MGGSNTDDIQKYLNVVVDEWFEAKSNDLDKAATSSGLAIGSLGRSCKYITLQSMENLKESVVLRSYQGRDPVSEYRNEAFKLFQGLEASMRLNSVFSLWQSLVTANQ